VGIAKEHNECISGEELDLLDSEGVRKIVKEKTVFARVTPTHKSMIVEALKNSGDIVAMTGDGVNDAPSLKMADIGISMGVNGSEVSKEASDMVLLDDNFSTIEKAVEQGRVIYDNIKKTILFLLSSNFAEIIVMIVSIFLKLPLPLLATHILIINLLTDSIPALALGVDKKENDVMKRNPRGKNEGIFSNRGIIKTILYGTVIGILTLVAFFLPSISMIRELGMKINLNNIQRLLTTKPEILAKSQTLAFMTLGCLELFYSVVSKNLSKSIYDKSRIKNKYLNLSIMAGILMVLICIYSPLSKSLGMFQITINEFAIMILFSMSIIFVHEFIYIGFHMKQKINKKAIKREFK
jgi:Ca2+-transporting ATPase